MISDTDDAIEKTFTVWSSYASAVLGIVILSVRPSVRPSVRHKRALWRNKKYTADIFIPQKW